MVLGLVLGLNWSYHICKVDVRHIWYLATLDILNMLQIRNVTKLTGAANCMHRRIDLPFRQINMVHPHLNQRTSALWLNYVTSRTNLKIVIYY